MNPLLVPDQVISGSYTVQFFIKSGENAETYRVKDEASDPYFLKLFTKTDSESRSICRKEMDVLSNLNHHNITKYRDRGTLKVDSESYDYILLDFISGETLAQQMSRIITIDLHSLKRLASEVLSALEYMHDHAQSYIHNDINNQNVMLDYSQTIPSACLIDFGHALSFFDSTEHFRFDGLNPFYLAPECYSRVFSPQSDLYSVGVLLYHALFGLPPWLIDISESDYKEGRWKKLILEQKQKPLSVPNVSNEDDEHLLHLINKALQFYPEHRFQSASEFKTALNDTGFRLSVSDTDVFKQDTSTQDNTESTEPAGNGFADIAGMDKLKKILQDDVISALQEKELYEQYKVSIPNGIMLYGPPGCGKTFFAEKLAEEVGFNFVKVIPSDLASIYVHGTQEKIGNLFKEARQNSPTIIFIDELDALLPDRSGDIQHGYASEVNEFLAQMTNSAKDDVFIIAATNRPEKIDSAILRTGRVDKIFYVPPPDKKARMALFELYLKERPLKNDIDYEKLSELTDHFVSSDIEFLVNESARLALKKRDVISQELLVEVISNNKPSVSKDILDSYESLKLEMEGDGSGKIRSIGFQ